jgi:hypothetical protein
MDEFLNNAEDILMDDEAREVELSASELLDDDHIIDDIAEITDEDIENYSLEDDEEYIRDSEYLEDDEDDIPDEIIYTSSEEEEDEDDDELEDSISDIIDDYED